MMISPAVYRKELEDASLKKLQRERDALIRYMKKYENHALPEMDYRTCPSPAVMYSCYKEYLLELQDLIDEKISSCSLSERCLDLYRNQYPDDYCALRIPGGQFVIEHDDVMYVPPACETDVVFEERLERSRKAGRNLFYEEWEVFEYEDDVVY